MPAAQQTKVDRLLQIWGLTVTYGESAGPALRDVDLQIERGEIIGILGESGSGKSTLATTLLGLLPLNAGVQGSISLQNGDRTQNLLQLNESGWRAIRGAKISTIFQEPSLSLSPVKRIGDQIADVILAHCPESRKSAGAQAVELLEELLPHNADRVYKAYPHQLSGGELHRAAIARALVCRPLLVIADEPTRDLDARIEADVLGLFREVNRKFGTAFIFITHNPALLAGFADRVAVMYAGQIVESGPLTQVYGKPLHPYTKGLLSLIPKSFAESSAKRPEYLPVIPGSLSASDVLVRGCTFGPRCPSRIAVCQQEFPAKTPAGAGRDVSCFNYGH